MTSTRKHSPALLKQEKIIQILVCVDINYANSSFRGIIYLCAYVFKTSLDV